MEILQRVVAITKIAQAWDDVSVEPISIFVHSEVMGGCLLLVIQALINEGGDNT